MGLWLTLRARQGGKAAAPAQDRGSCRAFALLGAIQTHLHGRGTGRVHTISTISTISDNSCLCFLLFHMGICRCFVGFMTFSDAALLGVLWVTAIISD